MGWWGAPHEQMCSYRRLRALHERSRETTSVYECESRNFLVCRRGRRRHQRRLCSQLPTSRTARHRCRPKGAPLSGNCGYQVDRNSERLCRLSCKAAGQALTRGSFCQDITYIYGSCFSVAASHCGDIIAHLCDIFEYSECLGQGNRELRDSSGLSATSRGKRALTALISPGWRLNLDHFSHQAGERGRKFKVRDCPDVWGSPHLGRG